MATFTETTTTQTEAWRPNAVANFNPDDIVPESLIVQCATNCGTVEGDAPAVLVPFVLTDAPAGFVPEGEEIDQTNAAFDQVKITTDKVSVLTRISREAINQPGAAARIAKSMSRSVISAADAAFLSNAADPSGLLNVAEIATAGDLGGATDGNLDALFDAIGVIENAGGTATHLIVNPLDWAKLSKIKTVTGSNVSLLSDAHTAALRALAGVPVIAHKAMTVGSALLLDQSEIAAALGGVMLARSDDAFFTSDSVAVRATWRIGWSVVRASRLQKLTVAAS